LRLYLLEKGIKQGHLSISDESQNALAFVILEAETNSS
jgi:holo-[acyl-carrier protein] synthase